MDITIPVSSCDGRQFLIKLSSFSIDGIPGSITEILKCEIIDIVLERVTDVDQNKQNSFGTLSIIFTVIWNFLEEHDVVLYFYCDDRHEILRKETFISPQEYRSKLFTSMFNRKVSNMGSRYVNVPIILLSEEFDIQKKVFMHLIARGEHLDCLKLLKDEIKKLSK